MKTTTLSSESAASIVKKSQNVANVATPVLTVTVPDGAKYTIPNTTIADGVLVNGAVIIADLRNSANERIRTGSMVIGYRTPAAEFVQNLRAVPLTTWADLSTTQQKDTRFRGTLAQATDLNVGPNVTLQNRASLVIQIESPEVIDWTKSYLETTVEEVNG